MRTFLAVALTFGLLVLPAQLGAQPGAQPGPEHQQFKEMEGTWDATIKSPEGESKGTATYKVGLGGLWLLEHFKADFGGTSFEGHGGTSYDANKKKYIGVWIDSMSPNPMVMEGTYDKAKKTMTMVGDMVGPDGKKARATLTTVDQGPDTKVFTMRVGPEGKQMEMLQITYKRRK